MEYNEFAKTKLAEDTKKAGIEITEEKYDSILHLNNVMKTKLQKVGNNKMMRTKAIREFNRDLCLLFSVDRSVAMLAYDAACCDPMGSKHAPTEIQPLLYCATIITCLN